MRAGLEALYETIALTRFAASVNSCPLCRYELPTDDKDYEEGKQNSDAGNVIHVTQQLDDDVMDDR